MSHLENFDHPLKKQNKEYYIHLVHIAKADDVVSHKELELLVRIGKSLGFTDPEIELLVETTGKSDYDPPYELSRRFNQVYEIMKMTLADGVIDKSEMCLARAFAIKSRFTESEIPYMLVLIMRGIREGKDVEDIYEVFKKNRKPS
jgi:hypothetical protein